MMNVLGVFTSADIVTVVELFVFATALLIPAMYERIIGDLHHVEAGAFGGAA